MISDVGELVLFNDSRIVGDTFIFEPAAAETKLGRLLVAIEIDNKGEIGRRLIDTLVNALQREYYRDPTRGQLPSLESALHQANLVLHEAAEQGIRDWMGSLHAAVGSLAGQTLHLSCAGEGVVLLVRHGAVTEISSGLAHSPITDPLRTFAQVASGVASSRDVLFFGTSQFLQVFRPEDLKRLVIDQTAGTMATRLRQLYEDQRSRAALAVLLVSLAPEEAAKNGPAIVLPYKDRRPLEATGNLLPRKPLNISSSLVRRLMTLIYRLTLMLLKKLRALLWLLVTRGGRGVATLTARTAPVVRQAPRKIKWHRLREAFDRLPKSSKVFAGLVLTLASALIISLVLLQQKRAADAQFQQASEFLHEARTKQEAAETALIYDNRDQTRTLLDDAEALAEQIEEIGLYAGQVTELRGNITKVRDRLDKVTRAVGSEVTDIGDFEPSLGTEVAALYYLQGSLYAFNGRDNTIARMGEDGAVTIVSRTNQGIGFFTVGAEHEADKSLVLMTDSPGVVLYDSVTEIVQKQEISFPTADAEIGAVATFGSRIYLYDKATQEIYGYSKTLRGYSGGDVWITDSNFPKSSIVSLGVDGYIYTLHADGSVYKLLKGAPVDFTVEKLEEPLTANARLHVAENLKHLYIFDPDNKRIVIYDTIGNLNQQIFLGPEAQPRDIAVAPDEKTLYVLDGAKIKAVSLAL